MNNGTGNSQTAGGGVMSEHTKEPWRELDFYQDVPGEVVGTHCLNCADYDRARACVNALAGMNPEGVAEAMEALVAAGKELHEVIEWHRVEKTPLRFAELSSIANVMHRVRAALAAVRQQEVSK